MMQYGCLLILGLQLETLGTSAFFVCVASHHKAACVHSATALDERKALSVFQIEVFDRYLQKEKQK